MSKVLIIKTMVLAVDLSTEEQRKLVKELVSEWKLQVEDVREKTETVEQPEKRKRGRPKKIKTEEEKTSVSKEAPKKRRGRPRKVQENKSDNLLPETLNPESKAPSVDVSAKEKKHGPFKKLEDYPSLQRYKMGAEQRFQIVYRWKNDLLLSAYVLTDLSPVGIYIPYNGKMFGKYRGFIVDMYDEAVLTGVKEALNYLQEKRQPFDDEQWSVMNSLQWATLKNIQGDVNVVLRKIGGDHLLGSYRRISPNDLTPIGAGKMRYTVDVK